jgi:hypothetical protein
MLPFGKDTSQIAEEEIIVEVPEPIVTEEIMVEEPQVEEFVVEEPVIEVEEIIAVEEIETVTIAPGEELIGKDLTWLQQDRDVFVTFHLTNQYPDKNLQSIEYRIRLLDADGEELRNEWNTFPWLFARQTLGIAFRAYMPEDSPAVDSVNIEYLFKTESPADEFENPFMIEKIKSWEGGSKLILTGNVTNHTNTVYTNVRVNYICYDAQDLVVGGGYTYIDFVPGNSGMGFNTLADTYGDVVRVEAFPTITYNTKTYADTPEFWSSINVLEHAYQENRFGNLMGGIVIQNNLADTILKTPVVAIVFYDAEGNITTFGSQKVPLLFPGDAIGLYPFIYSKPIGSTSVDYQYFVLPGEPLDEYEVSENVFRVDSVVLIGDSEEYAQVTYTNTYSKSTTEADIYVLAYDADGVIIGGGKATTKDILSPGASMETQVYIYYNRDSSIASVSAWVFPNTWTKYE